MARAHRPERLRDWLSLAPQLALAERLFGEDGHARVQAWLDEQLARVEDPAFAALFEGVGVEGAAPSDFNHRLVHTERGALLGGIRFYGQDVTRPFVEVVAHGFDDLEALRAVVGAEWRLFRPRALRLLLPPGAAPTPDAVLDQTVHIARYGEMAPPDERVMLAAFEDAEDAVAMVAARYAALGRDEPELCRDIAMADLDDVRAWHGAGTLFAIEAGGARVGLIAYEPGRVEWIEGDVVAEEVVAAEHGGRGYAASAQRALAARRREAAPERLLLGTIARRNRASRRSALRAGRAEALRQVFFPLPKTGAF